MTQNKRLLTEKELIDLIQEDQGIDDELAYFTEDIQRIIRKVISKIREVVEEMETKLVEQYMVRNGWKLPDEEYDMAVADVKWFIQAILKALKED